MVVGGMQCPQTFKWKTNVEVIDGNNIEPGCVLVESFPKLRRAKEQYKQKGSLLIILVGIIVELP